MAYQRLAALLVALIASIGFLTAEPAHAGLPQGNAVKDPAAILRDALPFDQDDLRDLQHRLEGTSDDLRAKRWSALSRSLSKTQALLTTRRANIVKSMPAGDQANAETLLDAVSEGIAALQTEVDAQDKPQFIQLRRDTLAKVGELEALLTDETIPAIPAELDGLPRREGRAAPAAAPAPPQAAPAATTTPPRRDTGRA